MSKRKKKPFGLYPFQDKEYCLAVYHSVLLEKTLNMFTYSALPESVPQRELERILQRTGRVTFCYHEGIPYAINGYLGASLNAYYLPTESICVNPWINLDKTYKIGTDCEVIYNNSRFTNVYEYADKYITQMIENDITQNMANINMRALNIIVCGDDDNKLSADEFIRKLVAGDLSAMVSNEEFMGSITTQPYSSTATQQVIQLIEYAQYLKGSLNNLFGFQDNLNLKREYVSSDELDIYNDASRQIVYDMLQNRKDGVDRINKLFGLDITVELNKDLYPVKSEKTSENVEEVPGEEPESVEDVEQVGEEIVNETPEETPEETEDIVTPEDVIETFEDIVDVVKDAIEDAVEGVNNDVDVE